jgi:hypothetical protein
MKRTLKKLAMIPLASIFLFCGVVSTQAVLAETVFDPSADFSSKNNPNRVWQYGYTAANSLDPNEFRIDKESESAGAIVFWHPATNSGPGSGYYPYVACNSSAKSEVGCKGWAVRPGEVAMEASNVGQYGVVRFVAPVSGSYTISAQFEGIHFGLSTTDVHVMHNGTSLFAADIDGYGGDPSFHKVEGSSPSAAYSGQIEMKANDTVTFAIGYGKNTTHFGDTTGLIAKVVLRTDGRDNNSSSRRQDQ